VATRGDAGHDGWRGGARRWPGRAARAAWLWGEGERARLSASANGGTATRIHGA
jgi:hypothetical protein